MPVNYVDRDAPRRQRAFERELERRRRRRIVTAALIAAGLIVVIVVAVAMGTLGSGSSGGGSGAGRALAAKHAVKSAGGTGKSAARAAARGTGAPGIAAVPILMYHVINVPPAGAAFPGLYVPAPEFAAQMRALKSAGWHAVTMDQLEAYWTRGVPLGPGKPIVLSFDNGYATQYTNAFPMLQRLGWVGVENIQLTGLPISQGGLAASRCAA